MCQTPPHVSKHTQPTKIRHDPSYKQLETKANRTSFLYIIDLISLNAKLATAEDSHINSNRSNNVFLVIIVPKTYMYNIV